MLTQRSPTLNVIDKMVGFFFPQKSYERLVYRSALSAYNAGTTRRGSADWNPANSTGENANALHRDYLRAKARDLERNSDTVNSILSACQRNVVGKGFNLQSKTDDVDWNNIVEEIWKSWCKPKNCDITGQQSFREILWLVLERLIIDGGILALKTYNGTSKYPFQLQLLEVDCLDSCGQTEYKGNKIHSGVELDKFNKPVAYWIKEQTDIIEYTAKRILADQLIYLWRRRRPSEYREITPIARTMDRIHDNDEFIDATGYKQKIASALAVFITNQLPVTNSISGRNLSEGSCGTGKKMMFNGQKITPGSMYDLGPGQDAKMLVANGQANELAQFCTISQRMSAAGQGISHEVSSRDVSQVNYSSARQNLLEDMKTFDDMKLFLIDHLLDEVFEEVITSAYLAGTISNKKYPDFFQKKEQYLAHEFIPQGMPWIDPVKEANANKISLETGQTNLKEIYAQKGKDWKEEIEQLSKEQELLEKMGLKGGSVVDTGK